ncbi:hypothetical protein AAGQ96_14645 [Pantoea sp. MBD-2R]|uniref:hypothetical protein n=1 Tax=Pantoea sp. MBD-2R TaxID=3141540 RepID=UPI003183A87D
MSDPVQSSLRLLQMCCELHRMGYQELQIYPAMSPSGVHWRLTLAPAAIFSNWHSCPDERSELRVHYGSGDGDAPFGWEASRSLTPLQLAQKFIQHWPELAKCCKGNNESYRAWLAELTTFCLKNKALPYFQADWPCDFTQGIPLTNGQFFPQLPETKRRKRSSRLLRLLKRLPFI